MTIKDFSHELEGLSLEQFGLDGPIQNSAFEQYELSPPKNTGDDKNQTVLEEDIKERIRVLNEKERLLKERELELRQYGQVFIPVEVKRSDKDFIETTTSKISFVDLSNVLDFFCMKYSRSHYYAYVTIIKETSYGQFKDKPIGRELFIKNKVQRSELNPCLKELKKDGWIDYIESKLQKKDKTLTKFFTLAADR